ncbi:MAG TPA: phosphoribosyl-ATP diphosphatase [Devosia sp.]|nr:phosphoribosyl-ATP diphosphatase [Devosia sp.]
MTMTLDTLNARIAVRAAASPDESYTARLLAAGVPRCAKKFGEESAELLIAAVGGNRQETAAEAADLLYHFLVLIKASGVGLEEVMGELDKRTAQTGLEEKASRKGNAP